MKAGNWAGLGVLFLLPSCIFPLFLLGALVCFIGMVIAIQQGDRKSMAGFNTQGGFVQATTNAHWSSFERVTGEYEGVFRVVGNDDAKFADSLRVGERLSVKPTRHTNERGVTIDSLVVLTSSGEQVGKLPAALDVKYTTAMKTEGAAFDATVHQILTNNVSPVILAEFRRCDAAYLSRVARAKFFARYGVYIAIVVFVLAGLAAMLFRLWRQGEYDYLF
jgi:hypothetical protein